MKHQKKHQKKPEISEENNETPEIPINEVPEETPLDTGSNNNIPTENSEENIPEEPVVVTGEPDNSIISYEWVSVPSEIDGMPVLACTATKTDKDGNVIVTETVFVDDIIDSKSATCADEGYKIVASEAFTNPAFEVQNKKYTTPATDKHQLNKFEVDPSCTKVGYIEKICIKCKQVIS
ncbi:MAG: hypothetical protein HUJ70_13960, partial [Pseudobutyrivibrio sp.]|nr:hypothetical protein [Pseudobutyrivibrio sp.]